MSARPIIIGTLTLVCLASVWAVIHQRQQLASLQTEQRTQTAALAEPAPEPVGSDAADATPNNSTNLGAGDSELLQLRSEVTRLTQRKQALAGAAQENQRLRAQLAARATNAVAAESLPPGFVRTSQARMAGYNSPQDTIQSLLWSLQNKDYNSLSMALTDEAARDLQREYESKKEAFWNEATNIIGMGLTDQQQLDDGSMVANMQMLGADAGPSEQMRFVRTNGIWKLAGPYRTPGK